MRKLLIVSALGLVLPLAFSNPATAAEGTQSALTAVSVQGTGHVVIAATAAGGVHESPPALTAQVEVAIHGAAPNTAFTVQHMVAAAGSGCTNLSEPLVLDTITTSAGGAGTLHFVRYAPDDVRGFQFDIVLQAIGADGTVLQSACMTVTVK